MQKLQKYNKFIIALVGWALTAVAHRYGANSTYQAILGLVTVGGVYHFGNYTVTVNPPTPGAPVEPTTPTAPTV